jgi:predicted alpha/beta-hydrolase family hydrolase
MGDIVQRLEERIAVGPADVSALCLIPDSPMAGLVLAHGAGAGMRHGFLERLAAALADRAIATVRYQFPYKEQGRSRPDRPAVAVATVRAAVAYAGQRLPGLPLLAGGKSFGGRMTSTAAAEAPLPGVAGLVFVGFPLHPPNRPGITRAAHLAQVTVPMLFLQGTRDDLADLELVRQVTRDLPLATVHVMEGADHSFAVLKRSGRTAGEVMAELADTIVEWGRAL